MFWENRLGPFLVFRGLLPLKEGFEALTLTTLLNTLALELCVFTQFLKFTDFVVLLCDHEAQLSDILFVLPLLFAELELIFGLEESAHLVLIG